LIAHLEQHSDVLDEEAKRRLHSNPLRISGHQKPGHAGRGWKRAPKLIDFLGRSLARTLQRRACYCWMPAA
jgi:histidyl-tRNA synthetase